MLPRARFGRAGESVAQLSRCGRKVRPLTAAADHATPGGNGRRILVIEDSVVVAPFVSSLLVDLGYEVVGPAPNMAAARELIDGETVDAALVDVFIRGERAFPLCELLASKGVPFVLTSGYADWQIPEQWLDRPRLNKPYVMEQLGEALAKLLDGEPAA